MSNIQQYKTRVELAKVIFSELEEEEYLLELVITVQQKNINIKELSSYLDLIYRMDGQMSELGYVKYVHYPKAQIEISEIGIGSWEIVIQKILASMDGDKLIITWLALKYLPHIVNTFIDTSVKVIDFFNKREEYLEKKDRRKMRKHIRDLISSEVDFSKLDKKSKEKLVDILDELYVKNSKRLIPSSRFSKKFIKQITLLPKKK